MRRGVEVRLELVDEHVEAGDLLCHGIRYLDQFGTQCGEMNEQRELQPPAPVTATFVATFSLMALILTLISSISRLSWFLTNSSRSIWYSLSSSPATLNHQDSNN